MNNNEQCLGLPSMEGKRLPERALSVRMNSLRAPSASSSVANLPGHEASSEVSSLERDLQELNSLDDHEAGNLNDQDPLHDDNILLQGLRIVEPGDDDALNTIRKVPSDQVLSMLRWGTSSRATGRSKSGLQILVPGPEVRTVITSGPLTGKSIVYAYTSSSSSSGKTISSHGAVGDHLTSAKASSLSSKEILSNAASNDRSRLADLLVDSIPDQDAYKLLVVGETGPCPRNISPHLISPSNFPLLPPRRRSLSDLIESRHETLSFTKEEVPKTTVLQKPLVEATDRPEKDIGIWRNGSTEIVESKYNEKPNELLEAPVWKRNGAPFELLYRHKTGRPTNAIACQNDLDPLTFQLPLGSKIFIMKSPNVYNLRASVATGVWSSSKGANKVLQSAWDVRTADEKIILMFSITQSPRQGGKYCGMAEVNGPYNPAANPQIWIEGLQGNEGIIPLRWIVVKDVDFCVFENLTYKGKAVTQLRHANTVPGEAGRCLVQTYFESEHSSTADIHPGTPMPPATPVKTPPRRRNWSALRASVPRRSFLRSGSNQRMMPCQNQRPAYVPALTGVDQGYSPYPYSGQGQGQPISPLPATYPGETSLDSTTRLRSQTSQPRGNNPGAYPVYGQDNIFFQN